MKQTYIQNLKSSMAEANVKSLKNKCGKSFDNKKIKTARRMLPRGKVFQRIERLEGESLLEKFLGKYYSILEDIKA